MDHFGGFLDRTIKVAVKIVDAEGGERRAAAENVRAVHMVPDDKMGGGSLQVCRPRRA